MLFYRNRLTKWIGKCLPPPTSRLQVCQQTLPLKNWLLPIFPFIQAIGSSRVADAFMQFSLLGLHPLPLEARLRGCFNFHRSLKIVHYWSLLRDEVFTWIYYKLGVCVTFMNAFQLFRLVRIEHDSWVYR